MTAREQHSADRTSFIEGTPRHWVVVFRGHRVSGTFRTREAARVCIREMKRAAVVLEALR